MKKKALLLSVLAVCTAFLIGFTVGHEAGRKTQPDVIYAPTFYATITDVGAQGLDVEGLEINQINYRGPFGFAVTEDTQLVWRGTPVELSELRPGLTVAVSFTGYVLETYPAGLTEVCKVEVLDDGFR